MAQEALGLLECKGLVALMEGSDAMLKAANVEMMGWDKAGSGMVKVTATGDQQIVSVSIDPSVMDDRELLEDLVRAATNEALRRAQQASAEKLSELAGSLPLPPGLLSGQ